MLKTGVAFCLFSFIFTIQVFASEGIIAKPLEFTVNTDVSFKSFEMNKRLIADYFDSITGGVAGIVDSADTPTGSCTLVPYYAEGYSRYTFEQIFRAPVILSKLPVLPANSKLYAAYSLLQRQSTSWEKETDPMDITDMVMITLYSSLEDTKTDRLANVSGIKDKGVVGLTCRLPVAHFSNVEQWRSSKFFGKDGIGELDVSKINKILNSTISVQTVP